MLHSEDVLHFYNWQNDEDISTLEEKILQKAMPGFHQELVGR